MTETAPKELLQIKKYPNRRYYDATRSRHVTLEEVHDLILGGHDVCVTDSRSGEDITNAVLTQILLEKDHLKLDLFPCTMLHFMIRSQPQTIRETVKRTFGPFFDVLVASRQQFDAYVRETAGTPLAGLFDWFARFTQAWTPPAAKDARDEPADTPPSAPEPDEGDLEELRRQVRILSNRIEELREKKRHGPDAEKKPPR